MSVQASAPNPRADGVSQRTIKRKQRTARNTPAWTVVQLPASRPFNCQLHGHVNAVATYSFVGDTDPAPLVCIDLFGSFVGYLVTAYQMQ